MVKGIVNYVGGKPWKDRSGVDVTLHSFRLVDNNTFYTCGTTSPGVEKGQLIEFDGTVKGEDKFQVNLPSIKILKEATTEVVQPTTGSTVKMGWRGSYKSNISKDDYWKRKEERDIANEGRREATQEIIQLQSSRNSAIAAAEVILDNGGLDLEKIAKGKKKEAIEALIDSLTEKYEQASAAKRSGEVATTEIANTLVRDVAVTEDPEGDNW